MKYQLSLAVILLCFSSVSWAALDEPDVKEADVTGMDMSDLLKLQVIATAKKSQITSVSKKAESLSDAPAAAFIISNDDIKRSGVTSIPEALRMAPGVDVARINSNKWAITARGFNGSFANKLLVLIDGRSVYTPAFAGVYWDAQDVMLEDVERIEVIRGPGATLWGSNAVNGVINIITKRAEQTQGGLLTGGGGTLEKGFAGLRYGTKLGKDTYGRVYVKGFDRNNLKSPESDNAGDGWNKLQGGFRLDSQLSKQDEITLQGDIYHTRMNQAVSLPNLATFRQSLADKVDSAGWNITSRFRHTFSSTAEYSVQFYYDHTQRDEYLARQWIDTLDIDFQNSFRLTEQQNVIWGLGYRTNMDKFAGSSIAVVNPYRLNTQLFTAFVQDEITLIDNALWFTLGSKFEHNDYTGFEGQPTARLMWQPSTNQRVWASVSRSVKTPPRADSHVQLLGTVVPSPAIPELGGASVPVVVTVNGNPKLQAEVQLSYELGYRLTFGKQASLDMTAFYNDYSKLRALNLGASSISASSTGVSINQPVNFNDSSKGFTYGFETTAVWQMTDWWRWDANYSYLETHVQQSLLYPVTATSPKHKASLRAVIDPIENVSLDFWLRYNGVALATAQIKNPGTSPIQRINDYVDLDIRLAWKAYPSLEFSLVGQNLLNTQHLQYTDELFTNPSEVSRGVYGKVSWGF